MYALKAATSSRCQRSLSVCVCNRVQSLVYTWLWTRTAGSKMDVESPIPTLGNGCTLESETVTSTVPQSTKRDVFITLVCWQIRVNFIDLTL